MNLGGFLYIINAIPSLLTVYHQDSYRMNSWNFSDVRPQTIGTYSVVYTPSANATVQYRFTGLNNTIQSFQIQWLSGVGIRVNWTNVDRTRYHIFPPVAETSTVADVGWIDGGIVSVLILDRYTTSTVKTITPTVSSLTESNKNHINIPLSLG